MTELEREVTAILDTAYKERGKCEWRELGVRMGAAVLGIVIFQAGAIWAGLSIPDRVIDELVHERLVDAACLAGDADNEVGEFDNLVGREGYPLTSHR